MEVDNILAMGVTLHTRVTLGRDISFGELRSKFDAVLLATGLNKAFQQISTTLGSYVT